MARGTVERTPNAKGAGRVDPYPHGNKARCEKGRGGRRMGRGGFSKVWRKNGATGPSGQGNKMQNAPKNHLVKKKRVGNKPCYECGFDGHWYRTAM